MTYSASDITAEVHDSLGNLASDLGWTAAGTQYDYPLTAALRVLSGGSGMAASSIDAADFTKVVDLTRQFALVKLRNVYLTYVDTAVGQRRESLSQIAQGIGKQIAIAPVSACTLFNPGTYDPYSASNIYGVSWWERLGDVW